MVDAVAIEFRGLSKRFGGVSAVDNISASIAPGRVTGFLGPNGAGKTTSLRMLLGLVAPSAGSATFGGRAYRDLPQPMRTVGAALEANSFHPGRSARGHLSVYAQAGGIDRGRVDEVLGLVGLAPFADRRVDGYSMGMRQRLGLASALLGDPAVLVLDEPSNGLDPEGIRWMRGFLRSLADEGRTVLVSSHLLGEVQQSVDDVIIIAGGTLRHQGTLAALEAASASTVVVDAPDRAALAAALTAAGLEVAADPGGGFVVSGVGADAGRVGAAAFSAGVALSALTARRTGLEDTFLAIVGEGASA